LRTESRQDGRAPQAMELGTALEEEPHEPPDGEPYVGDCIGHVQNCDQTRPRQQHLLELGLDMNSKASLGRHDPFCISAGLRTAAVVHDRVPDKQVNGVHAESDRGLASPGEGASPTVPSAHGTADSPTYPATQAIP
jgi:hypothetical protein